MRKVSAICFCICFLVNILCARDFVLVIDAGHGGDDPGAIGTKVQEKDLNLKIALLVGEKIKQKCSDVNIVYTRAVDKTVALKDRPLIANKVNGDFFISIHANANDNKKACGTETYVIGIDKSNANFEVAKRENSVILLEKNKESYKGFNPNSPDSYIMFELMQDLYIDQSLLMAEYIQKQFNKQTDRIDRGVRQGPFWVLHQTKMPSVLVEMGFVSNALDQAYMISKTGQNQIAESIATAFELYKKDYDKKNVRYAQSSINSDVIEENMYGNSEIARVDTFSVKTDDKDTLCHDISARVIFKVQLFAVKKVLEPGDATMQGERDLEYYEEGGMVKYTTKELSSYQEALFVQKKMKVKFSDCFIIAFLYGKKVSIREAQDFLNNNK